MRLNKELWKTIRKNIRTELPARLAGTILRITNHGAHGCAQIHLDISLFPENILRVVRKNLVGAFH
jgi:hypothetical protein